MAEAEIHNRRGSYVKAYLHYGQAQPDDLDTALRDVVSALEVLEEHLGSTAEGKALKLLGLRLAGLRERMDAATVDIAVRLRQEGSTLEDIAGDLHTVRGTIHQWLKQLEPPTR